MKRLMQVAAVVFMFGQSHVQADDSHHPKQGQGAATAVSPASSSSGMGMGMMDMDRMQEMHKMMERIQQSKDPAERQRLMQEHMDQMHKMMSDMHGMMGMGMNMPMEERQQMMDKRMDMMQQMMEQMMDHMMVAQPPAGQAKEKPGDEHEHKDAK